VANSTIGGCTLFFQTAANGDAKTIALLEEDWDYIVLQDYSALPTVAAGEHAARQLNVARSMSTTTALRSEPPVP